MLHVVKSEASVRGIVRSKPINIGIERSHPKPPGKSARPSTYPFPPAAVPFPILSVPSRAFVVGLVRGVKSTKHQAEGKKLDKEWGKLCLIFGSLSCPRGLAALPGGNVTLRKFCSIPRFVVFAHLNEC